MTDFPPRPSQVDIPFAESLLNRIVESAADRLTCLDVGSPDYQGKSEASFSLRREDHLRGWLSVDMGFIKGCMKEHFCDFK
jgi:hypothetical protein